MNTNLLDTLNQCNSFCHAPFTYDCSNFRYHEGGLKNLYQSDAMEDHKHRVHGFFLNTKGKFGDQYIAILDTEYVSLPPHLNSKVASLLDDSNVVAAINNGSIGIDVCSYEHPDHGTLYTVKFIPMDDADQQ